MCVISLLNPLAAAPVVGAAPPSYSAAIAVLLYTAFRRVGWLCSPNGFIVAVIRPWLQSNNHPYQRCSGSSRLHESRPGGTPTDRRQSSRYSLTVQLHLDSPVRLAPA